MSTAQVALKPVHFANVLAPPTPPLSETDNASLSLDVFKEQRKTYTRRLGDTELSYYLPARAEGVNDMYLHIGFTAPKVIISYRRVLLVWALLRLRNPPLASRIHSTTVKPGVPADSEEAYRDIFFSYDAPKSVEEVIQDAERALVWREGGKDELIHEYLNGPRTLSDDKISYLVFSTRPSSSTSLSSGLPTPAPSPNISQTESLLDSPDDDEHMLNCCEYDTLMAAAHFLGDGMALHRFMNEFFSLLFGSNSTNELESVLEREWAALWRGNDIPKRVLPESLETYLPSEGGRFKRAAAQIDFKRSQTTAIGGHMFPRPPPDNPSSLAPKASPFYRERRTIVPTIALSEAETKKALKKCKEHGVSIANALFALSAIAWAKVVAESGATEQEKEKARLPILMYSALNLRPSLLPTSLERSYWFTAVGYFNVVLPAFLPNPASTYTDEKALWLRARSAKAQSTDAAKNKMLITRTHAMARLRGERARRWAKEDDEKDAGIVKAKPGPKPVSPAPAIEDPKPWCLPPAPSAALLGLSLLGNLDATYQHSTYTSASDAHKFVKLHTLTTGSRQRAGALLLFGYTFAGRLWVSLGYDVEGFAKSGGNYGRATVDGWWEELLKGLQSYLVD